MQVTPGNSGMLIPFGPWLRIGGLRLSTFRVCGAAGLTSGIGLAILVARHLQFSPYLFLASVAGALAGTFVVMIAGFILTGGDGLVRSRCEVSSFIAVWMTSLCAKSHVLSSLDLSALVLAVFIAFAKLGCFAAGCCHGRPHRHGVTYGTRHFEAGCWASIVGIRIFPLQLIESFFMFVLTLFLSWILTVDPRSGKALTAYILLCGIARVWLDELRGDPGRISFFGFSEAQWTFLAGNIGLLYSDHLGFLKLNRWEWIIAIATISSFFVLALVRCIDSRRTLFSPEHLWETVSALQHLERLISDIPQTKGIEASSLHMMQTTAGLQIAGSRADWAGQGKRHYSVSKPGDELPRHVAYRIARLIRASSSGNASYSMIAGSPGVYHIVFDA